MAGYSGTPLAKKLGYKENFKVKIVSAPEDYWDWLSPLPEGVMTAARGPYHLVHLFVTSRTVFEKAVLDYRKKIVPDGMIWISWPKKSSKVESDLDENIIRNFALENKLVDVKVCAVTEIWSGLKLVIPVKLRK